MRLIVKRLHVDSILWIENYARQWNKCDFERTITELPHSHNVIIIFKQHLEQNIVARVSSPKFANNTHCFHILHATVVREKLPKQLSFPVISVILLLVWFDCAKISLSRKLPHMSHEYDLLICMVSARQLYCLIKPSLLQNIYCWTHIYCMKQTQNSCIIL